MDVIEELKFLGKFTKKKYWGGGGWVRLRGVRVDANEELKFLCKFKKRKYIYFFFLGGGGRVGGGDVIEELKFLGKFTKKNPGGRGGGQGGCE